MKIWFEEDGSPLWECNDCGVLIERWREICSKCERWYDERGMQSPGMSNPAHATDAAQSDAPEATAK